MKLHKLTVSKLFDRLDYSLSFEQDVITIITGPNGYGKTILLKIINNFMTKNLNFFFEIKFDSIDLGFSDFNIRLKVANNILFVEKKDSITSEIKSYRLINNNINEMDFVDAFESSNGNLVKKKFIKINLNNNTFLEELNEDIDLDYTNDLKWLDEIIGETQTTFIKAQRLETSNNNRDTGRRTELTIKSFSKDLTKRIKKASAISSNIAQKLDSTFPRRLFEFAQEYRTPSSIEDRLLGLQRTRNNFISYGLLESDKENDAQIPNHGGMDKAYTSVLSLYIEDALEKLRPYNELYNKVDLFVSLLNEKMLAFKSVKIGHNRGFYFISDTGDEIELENLSSGEQNQIVLFYDLIFNTKENSIVLIDEPEISLHVAWQKEFLDGLGKILKVNHIDKVIIATHSPQVINGKWNLTIDLFKEISGER
ncbi:cytochrome c biogenesis protein CcmA [Yersinia frederiksenii]|uniref:AAA family ATPase n=1 Tax=Yersinia frederiksenii TaxID=29484 RepID=UPI0005DE1432|nr:AAA family ATPase [Yersinia frederiksenii]CFQ86419.1 cytochrome c biogenesis protein CcmA [Yersinia frederiksenii]